MIIEINKKSNIVLKKCEDDVYFPFESLDDRIGEDRSEKLDEIKNKIVVILESSHKQENKMTTPKPAVGDAGRRFHMFFEKVLEISGIEVNSSEVVIIMNAIQYHEAYFKKQIYLEMMFLSYSGKMEKNNRLNVDLININQV